MSAVRNWQRCVLWNKPQFNISTRKQKTTKENTENDSVRWLSMCNTHSCTHFLYLERTFIPISIWLISINQFFGPFTHDQNGHEHKMKHEKKTTNERKNEWRWIKRKTERNEAKNGAVRSDSTPCLCIIGWTPASVRFTYSYDLYNKEQCQPKYKRNEYLCQKSSQTTSPHISCIESLIIYICFWHLFLCTLVLWASISLFLPFSRSDDVRVSCW